MLSSMFMMKFGSFLAASESAVISHKLSFGSIMVFIKKWYQSGYPLQSKSAIIPCQKWKTLNFIDSNVRIIFLENIQNFKLVGG